MFYEENMDSCLRMGDVVSGFILSYPTISGPFPKLGFQVEMKTPTYAVVLSPCCSIDGGQVALAPLTEVRASFYKNPYFSEDLTRINRPMDSQQANTPDKWESFSPEERAKKLSEGKAHALVELFIYAEHDLFPKYVVKTNIETRFRMVDFQYITRVSCPLITRANERPINTKYLQLSIETRAELRNKLLNYFGRIPHEDRVIGY